MKNGTVKGVQGAVVEASDTNMTVPGSPSEDRHVHFMGSRDGGVVLAEDVGMTVLEGVPRKGRKGREGGAQADGEGEEEEEEEVLDLMGERRPSDLTPRQRYLTLSGIILVILIFTLGYPAFDIWAFFGISNINVIFHRLTFGLGPATFQFSMFFLLCLKLAGCRRHHRGLLALGFVVGWLMRCGLTWAPAFVAWRSAEETDYVSASVPLWIKVASVVGRTVLLTFVLPIFFFFYRRQRHWTTPTEGWHPNDAKLTYLLLPWIAAFIGVLVLGEWQSETAKANIVETTYEDEGYVIRRETWPLLGTEVAAYIIAWVPCLALCAMIFVDKRRKICQGYGFSLQHMMAYMWIIQLLPFLSGSVLNYFYIFKNHSELSTYIVQVVYIAVFALLTFSMIQCVEICTEREDVVSLFPIFYFEYFFGEIFFVEFKNDIRTFWILLGMQSLYITLRSSGIIFELVDRVRTHAKSYFRGYTEQINRAAKPVLSMKKQVQYAFTFLMADLLALFVIPTNFTIFGHLLIQDVEKGGGYTVKDLNDYFRNFELPDRVTAINTLIERFRNVLVAKLPFHILAFFIIAVRMARLRRNSRRKEHTGILDICYDHLRGGRWIFIVAAAISVSAAAYENLSNITTCNAYRQPETLVKVNVTDANITIYTETVHDDFYIIVYRDTWFSH